MNDATKLIKSLKEIIDTLKDIRKQNVLILQELRKTELEMITERVIKE